MEILFMRHKCKDSNFSKIYTKISYNAERIEVGSTNIKINSEHWDLKSKRVTNDDPLARFKNEQLSKIESDIYFAYNLLLRKEEKIDVKKLKRCILAIGEPEKEEESEKSFIEIADIWLESISNHETQDRKLSVGSLRKYKNVRDSLLKFFIHQKKTTLKISEFTPAMLRKFKNWMDSELSFAPTTIYKRCQVVKQIANWGVKNEDCCHINPIEDITFIEPEPEDFIFLNNEEFSKLKNHKFRTKSKQEVADLFVIFCRTGFHFADLVEIVKTARNKEIEKKHFKMGIDGKMWIFKTRIKTKVVAKVPYFEEVEQILNKYEGWENLPVKSNAKMNSYLKLIAEELNFTEELTEKLSVKAGRKTLVDWLLNDRGWSTDGVMVLLGIKNLRYLARYGKADERRVVIEINKSKKFTAFLEAQELESLKTSNISSIISNLT